MKTKRIVVIDDEPDIVAILSHNLQQEKYEVSGFTDPNEALAYIHQHACDLVLTDWLMPSMDGLDICRRLKNDENTSAIPIFMLSCKSDEIDIVTALEIGADDYMPKPFKIKELMVRIKKTLKRQKEQEIQPCCHMVIRSNMVIDTEKHTTHIGDQNIELTQYEFKILHLLASKPDRVFSREEIIEKINGDEGAVYVTLRSVDVQIVGLRKKLGTYQNHIKTIRSVGYKYCDCEE